MICYWTVTAIAEAPPTSPGSLSFLETPCRLIFPLFSQTFASIWPLSIPVLPVSFVIRRENCSLLHGRFSITQW
jgi:hypothetical protein